MKSLALALTIATSTTSLSQYREAAVRFEAVAKVRKVERDYERSLRMSCSEALEAERRLRETIDSDRGTIIWAVGGAGSVLVMVVLVGMATR